MPINKALTLTALAAIALCSCSGGGGEAHRKASKGAPRNFYARDAASQVRLTLFDPTGGKVGETTGTYVDGDIVAAPLSLVKGAYSAKMTTLTRRDTYPVYGYTAFDFRTDVVLLRVGKRNNDYARTLSVGAQPSDTLFGVYADYDGKVFRLPLQPSKNPAALRPGSGVFDNGGRLRAMAGSNEKMVTAKDLDSLTARQTTQHSQIYDLRLKSDKKYVSYTKVAGFKVRTTMGDFVIRLYDDVAEYRDNFIKLVSDHYYDSLLVHRVLPSFLIQTGAADTKYAKAGDTVGWQGPGYTLPILAHQKHFHKRGAVAASKLPPDRNPQNRCDGGQFYVVCGRQFSSAELDKIGREGHKAFTPEQRQAYTTVGGAPHLDGDYVVFGEVTQGMDVVDKISRVELTGDKGDRPARDVRVMSVTMMMK